MILPIFLNLLWIVIWFFWYFSSDFNQENERKKLRKILQTKLYKLNFYEIMFDKI